MPHFGAHMSIAGGLYKAALRAKEAGCEAVQLFTASPHAWQVKPIPPPAATGRSGADSVTSPTRWASQPINEGEVRRFRATICEAGLKWAIGHDSYLINLASPEEALYRKSVEAFIGELSRAEALGLSHLVMHPGARLDSSEEAGLARAAGALDEVHARCPGFRVRILLETTAGQGSTLGHRFEHLATILRLVKEPERLGVCLDTCHVFAAGYSLAPEKEYRLTMRAFDRAVGLARIEAFHLNDSLKPCGSRVDRHAHIGRGEMGLTPFRLVVNDPAFRDRPMVLETPKEEGDEGNMDAVNLATLRRLLKANRVA